MADIGQLVVKIAADASELEKELSKIGRAGKSFSDDLKQVGKTAALGLTIATAAATAMSIAIYKLASTTADTGDALQKMSVRTGETVETLSELSFVAKLANTDATALQKGYKDLSLAAYEASRGSKEQTLAFKQLGISIFDAHGVLKPTGVLFTEVSDKLARMNSATNQTAIGTAIFKKGYLDLAPVLLQGSAALKEQIEQAHTLGLVWDTEAAMAAEHFNDNLTRLYGIFEGLKNIIGNALIPVLNQAADSFIRWYSANAALIQLDVRAWAQSFAESVAQAIRVLIDFVDTLRQIGQGPIGKMIKIELAGLATVFYLITHAIQETSIEMQQFFNKLGKDKSVKKFWDDVAIASKKALDESTKGKLERLWNLGKPGLKDMGGVVGPFDEHIKNWQKFQAEQKRMEGMQETLAVAPAKPFELIGPETIKGIAIVERSKAILENTLTIEKQRVKDELRLNELVELTGLNYREMTEQEQLGAQATANSIFDYENRNAELETELMLAQANAEQQAVFYAKEQGMFGAAEAARRVQITLISKQYALDVRRLDDTLGAEIRYLKAIAEAQETSLDMRKLLNERIIQLEEQKHNKLLVMEQNAETKKEAVAQQFPTFWEKQLKDFQASNVFSMGQMVSTWSNSIATMIVKGGDLQAAIESTKIAIVQAFITMAAQGVVSAATTASTQAAAAAFVTAAWAGALGAISGFFGAFAGYVTTMAVGVMEIVTAVAEWTMGILEAIAAALGTTPWTVGFALALVAGIALIAAALYAAKVIEFAEGGVVTGPTLGLVGEAGPEAIIPLDRMGEFGGGNDRPIITKVYLEGRQIARAMARHTSASWRAEGAGA